MVLVFSRSLLRMGNNRDVTAISNRNSERQRTRRVNGISSFLRNQQRNASSPLSFFFSSSLKQTIPCSTAHRLILRRWYTWAIHYVIQYRGWSTWMCNRSFAMNRKWNRSRIIIIGSSFFFILSLDWTASVKYFIIDWINRSIRWMPCQRRTKRPENVLHTHEMRVCRSRLQCLLREYDTSSRCWTESVVFFVVPSSPPSCNTIHATMEAVSSSSSPIHRHDHRIRPAAFCTLNKWSASVAHDKRERYVVLSKCMCVETTFVKC